jgi:hypothetical protein
VRAGEELEEDVLLLEAAGDGDGEGIGERAESTDDGGIGETVLGTGDGLTRRERVVKGMDTEGRRRDSLTSTGGSAVR